MWLLPKSNDQLLKNLRKTEKYNVNSKQKKGLNLNVAGSVPAFGVLVCSGMHRSNGKVRPR